MLYLAGGPPHGHVSLPNLAVAAISVIAIGGLLGRVRDLSLRDKETARRLTAANEELSEALAKIKTLSGLIPICAHCKSIRDDDGYWQQLEGYLQQRAELEFTHGICPGCLEKHYPSR